MDDSEAISSISDPGEIDRDTHNQGDRAVIQIGNVLAWLFPILMLIIVAQVLLRNFGRIGFGPGNQAWMDDLQWWVYGIACLVGIAYAVTTNSHVRVDIFFDKFPKARQRRVDLFALGWLFLPFTIVVWDVTFHFAVQSVESWEGSSSPNGLHNLWILKILVNATFVLLAIAIVGRVLRLLSEESLTDGWSKFLWMLPSVVLMLNLTVFYLAWWATKLTQPDIAPRAIGRDGYLMGEFEVGPYESHYTVWIAIVLASCLGALLYVRRAR